MMVLSYEGLKQFQKGQVQVLVSFWLLSLSFNYFFRGSILGGLSIPEYQKVLLAAKPNGEPLP